MTQKLKKLRTSDSRRTFFRRFFAGMIGTGVATTGIVQAASQDDDRIPSTPSVAAEPLIGEVMMFAGTFTPRGWAPCDGQILQIQQNTALFSLLGTTYGGDGRTTFALPDLDHPQTTRGQVPVRYFIALQGIYPSRN